MSMPSIYDMRDAETEAAREIHRHELRELLEAVVGFPVIVACVYAIAIMLMA